MDKNALLQASRKEPPPGKVIVVALLATHGLFLIIIGLIAVTIALEVINLIVWGCALMLRLFAPWPIALSMSVAGVILLYVLIVIGPRTLSH